MYRIKRVNRLTAEILKEITERIVKEVSPEKIILFGSYAYGRPHKNSDLDILVIKATSLPRHKRAIPIYNALRGLIIPKDILVYTPEEVEVWKNVPQSFIFTVLQKGKVLYEKTNRDS